ncbi:hypothetical protein A11Q_2133 [Pseudobdellovibrio exovorus JSS]|uniref:Uncharacterized protein n=2 Tax=Pseudobdellovibrio exovorus TaxID=453816 RepID=M4VT12_9BACT|nr:hypothetical protein A11Q_2133 [Pseudobdellovibrio exovorus JSS]
MNPNNIANEVFCSALNFMGKIIVTNDFNNKKISEILTTLSKNNSKIALLDVCVIPSYSENEVIIKYPLASKESRIFYNMTKLAFLTPGFKYIEQHCNELTVFDKPNIGQYCMAIEVNELLFSEPKNGLDSENRIQKAMAMLTQALEVIIKSTEKI